MSEFVSVGYTPQTTDICVCRRHVDNVGPTGQRHSVKSAYFLANKIVSGNRIPDTLSYQSKTALPYYFFDDCFFCYHDINMPLNLDILGIY